MSTNTILTLDSSILAAAFCETKAPILAERKVKDLKSLSEEELARKIQAGRKDLISTLVHQHSDRLFRIILHMVQSHNAAEDILQDTWVRIIRKFHQYNPSRPLSSWLTQIAINRCRDYWRRERLRSLQKRPDSLDIDKTLSPDFHTEVERQVYIKKVLMTLSPKIREVVVLKFYSGLTHDEIAHVLRVPTGTVKSRLHFALNKLREHLDNKGEKR